MVGHLSAECPAARRCVGWESRPRTGRVSLYEQAIRIAQAVALAQGIPGARERVVKLKKRLNRLTTQDEQAQDFLFELEVGARFTRLGLAITFDEPDIVLHSSDGHRLGLACKRPRNVRRLRERLGEAADQITAGIDQGVIVIGVEPLFHRSNDPQRPTVTYLGDPAMVRAEANRIQAGISTGRRVRPSSRPHQHTECPRLMRTSYTTTERPNQGCHGYETSRDSVLWVLRCRLVQRASHAGRAGRPADTEPGPGQPSGESPGLSVADALSWAVSHAEGRVTQAIGIALTTPIYEFATHTLL